MSVILQADTGMLAICKDANGLQLSAPVLHISRFRIVFEIHSPVSVFRVSEVLEDFRLMRQNQTLFFGKALITGLIAAGPKTVCETSLDGGWVDAELLAVSRPDNGVRTGFLDLIKNWQKTYRIRPDYKLVVTDLQSFLIELCTWVEQVELGVRALASADRLETERQIARELTDVATPTLNTFLEQFEAISEAIEPEARSAHRVLCRRQLHPLLMSCPFMHRIYTKPLGYAGDYEMMNMIWRHGAEGGSLFAKLLQLYILDQIPAVSVRNRVEYLTQRIMDEALRVTQMGRPVRIYSLGCGPAREVERFLEHPLADQAEIQLLDFNEETLDYASRTMSQAQRTHHRATEIKTIKKSVHNLLKESGKAPQPDNGHDLIYSSGLYDYLDDRVSKKLNTLLYDQLRPGGKLIISNFDPGNPIRNLMEHVFEWFLIHRNSTQMRSLCPAQAPPDAVNVWAEPTGCNVFLEVRKPAK